MFGSGVWGEMYFTGQQNRTYWGGLYGWGRELAFFYEASKC